MCPGVSALEFSLEEGYWLKVSDWSSAEVQGKEKIDWQREKRDSLSLYVLYQAPPSGAPLQKLYGGRIPTLIKNRFIRNFSFNIIAFI